MEHPLKLAAWRLYVKNSIHKNEIVARPVTLLNALCFVSQPSVFGSVYLSAFVVERSVAPAKAGQTLKRYIDHKN